MQKVWVHLDPQHRDCVGLFGLCGLYVVGQNRLLLFIYKKKYGSIWTCDGGTVQLKILFFFFLDNQCKQARNCLFMRIMMNLGTNLLKACFVQQVEETKIKPLNKLGFCQQISHQFYIEFNINFFPGALNHPACVAFAQTALRKTIRFLWYESGHM